MQKQKWIYKVAFMDKLPEPPGEKVNWAAEMNRLGTEAWEAFWVSEKPEGVWVFFKAPRPN